MMNLSTLNTISAALSTIDFENKDKVLETLAHEVALVTSAENRKAEQKSAKLAEYAVAHDLVMDILRNETVPVTVAELWDELAEQLSDFTKGKLSYALTRLWTDEVAKVEGKVNSYTLKA